MEIIKLQEIEMLGKKPVISPTSTVYIAGGAIRQWFTDKEEVSDIDVFGTTEQSLLDFEKSLVGYTKLYENKLNKTYKKGDVLVQLIIAKYFPTVKELFEYFDFNICQFAWTNNEIYSTSSAIISTLRGHLGVNKIHPEFAADSLRRAFKYQKKGFVPCNGTILELAKSFRTLTEEQINNQVQISPGGGNRIMRFD